MAVYLHYRNVQIVHLLLKCSFLTSPMGYNIYFFKPLFKKIFISYTFYSFIKFNKAYFEFSGCDVIIFLCGVEVLSIGQLLDTPSEDSSSAQFVRWYPYILYTRLQCIQIKICAFKYFSRNRHYCLVLSFITTASHTKRKFICNSGYRIIKFHVFLYWIKNCMN